MTFLKGPFRLLQEWKLFLITTEIQLPQKKVKLVSQSNICCWTELKAESGVPAGLRDPYNFLVLITGNRTIFWIIGNIGQFHKDMMNKKSSSHLTLAHPSFQMGRNSKTCSPCYKNYMLSDWDTNSKLCPQMAFSLEGRLVKNNYLHNHLQKDKS